MEAIQTLEDAREATKDRAERDWGDIEPEIADFDGFASTAEYANYTLPYLQDLAESVEDEDTHYLKDELVNLYWEQAHEVVHD